MKTLALGGADCLWDDVAASEDLLGERWWDIVVACNEAGRDWPHHLDHWCSLHPDKLLRLWAPEREADDYETWSDPNRGDRDPAPTDHHLENWGGSSGMFCVQVAIEVGAERVVCCGMPMDDRPHYHGRASWDEAESFWGAWLERAGDLRPRIRSMSGRTRELLGAPTTSWALCSDEPRHRIG